jgi:hypothetical protein
VSSIVIVPGRHPGREARSDAFCRLRLGGLRVESTPESGNLFPSSEARSAMQPPDALRVSDAAVVARYLQVRSLLHDRHLALVERLVLDRYEVHPTRRMPATLSSCVRTGFLRPGEGELWPVVFLTTVDVSLGLCVELSPETVAGLGTTLNGPRKVRHRGWEDWWGWEKPIGQIRPGFFDLAADAQEEAIVAWYTEGLEWLAGAGLLQRR